MRNEESGSDMSLARVTSKNNNSRKGSDPYIYATAKSQGIKHYLVL